MTSSWRGGCVLWVCVLGVGVLGGGKKKYKYIYSIYFTLKIYSISIFQISVQTFGTWKTIYTFKLITSNSNLAWSLNFDGITSYRFQVLRSENDSRKFVVETIKFCRFKNMDQMDIFQHILSNTCEHFNTFDHILIL